MGTLRHRYAVRGLALDFGAEKQAWGLKGNLNKAAAIERVTSAAVESAPAKGANYAFIDTPSEWGPSSGGASLNLNAFSDASVEYYKCSNLPAEH